MAPLSNYVHRHRRKSNESNSSKPVKTLAPGRNNEELIPPLPPPSSQLSSLIPQPRDGYDEHLKSRKANGRSKSQGSNTPTSPSQDGNSSTVSALRPRQALGNSMPLDNTAGKTGKAPDKNLNFHKFLVTEGPSAGHGATQNAQSGFQGQISNGQRTSWPLPLTSIQGPAPKHPDRSYVKGDSYPPTSSGRIDDDEHDDQDLEAGQSISSGPSSLSREAAPYQTYNSGRVLESARPIAVPARMDGPSRTRSNEQSYQLPMMWKAERSSIDLSKPPAPSSLLTISEKDNEEHDQALSARSQYNRQARSIQPTPTQDSAARPLHGFSRDMGTQAKLDYDLQDLLQLDYITLDTEPFDGIAKDAVNISLPEDKIDASLAEKLEYVGTLDAKQQSEFFASLGQDDWEEAGDWFADQFAALTRKIRDCRRERRQLAREFEAEIAEHHSVVVKEQQALNSALMDMKKSGALVVQQGTPKPR